MAQAVKLTISVDGELVARMKEAGLSPSAVMADALRSRLDGPPGPSPEARIASLEAVAKRHARQIAAIERQMRQKAPPST